MSVKHYNGKYFSKKHLAPSSGESFHFAEYLREVEDITSLDELEVLGLYRIDKIFREYQIFCVRNKLTHDCAQAYGLRGLFG